MEIILTLKRKITKKDYRKYIINHSLSQGIWYYLIIGIALSTLAVITIKLNYYVLNIVSFLIFFSIYALGFILVIILTLFMNYKITMKTNKIGLFKLVEIWDFYDDYISITDEKDKDIKNKLLYSNFYKVKESKFYYYMYLDLRMAFIVKKEDMSKEEIDKLRELLKLKLGKAFKSKY